MKLQAFNGGKSTRLAPHLIGVNEAVEYTNIDSEPGYLAPVKKKLDLDTILLEYAHYFNYVGVWVSHYVNRDYLEYRNTLYFSEDGTNPKKSYNGTDFYNLGISPPLTAPVIATSGAGPLTGTYQYVITFYNSADGAESKPSPLTGELVCSSNQVNLSSLPISSDPQVDRKRIYRIGGYLTNFTLVDDVSAAASVYVDSISDVDVEGTILETAYYSQAPSGIKFLTEHYGILMGAKGDSVYFTPIGKPDAWPDLNFIRFDSDVTGIGKLYNGILVFTYFKTYIITGTNTSSFVKNLLSDQQGCKEHKSIQYLSSGEVLWVSNDGICATVGSDVRIVSKDKLGKINLSPVNAVVHDEVYYLQKTDGSIFSVDTRYGLIFKDFNHDTTRLVTAIDTLYAYNGNRLYELFADATYESYTWKSPILIEGSFSELKQYKSIFIRYNGTSVIKLYMDDVLIATKTLSGNGVEQIKVPQDKQDGYALQLVITGTATIYEIEYKPLGRRNN